MIYIKSAKQISVQAPLSEAWLTEPLFPRGGHVCSQDPPFRQWLSPMESRRLGKLLKRALVTASEALSASSVTQPDAIVTGTGLGCIENTELLLNQMCREGDTTLKPTNFMQSTHNTIGSLIAISNRCHGYNSTYSHKAVSFESALLDAFIQLRLGDISTALVTGNDEMTPSYFTILKRGGYLGQPGQVPATEASVAMVLSTDGAGALCQLSDVQLSTVGGCRFPSSAFDAVLVGFSGSEASDSVYRRLLRRLPNVPLLHYKHIFGDGYCSSALGLYAAAHIVARGSAPAHFRCDGADEALPVSRLLMVNHSDGVCLSFVSVSAVA